MTICSSTDTSPLVRLLCRKTFALLSTLMKSSFTALSPRLKLKLALKLLKFAQEEKLNLNVHYCSLENKHFGQVYQQNLTAGNSDPSFVMSERDFYLKTVKAFGKDAKEAERLLKAKGRRDYRIEMDYIQFSPDCAELLRKKDMELGISYNIREIRDREEIIRELRLDAVKAAEFDGRWI